jgi:alcohol dehydrogenase class IV
MIAPFQMARGPRVRFGRGEAAHIGVEAQGLGMKRPMLLADPGLTQAGVLQPITGGFEKGGAAFHLFEEIEPNPSVESVLRAKEVYESEGCDGMVAVGGGSAIDTAKAMGALLTNGGKISDYYGADKVAQRVPPFITVPTTAGTGSEATRASIVTDVERQTKASIHSDALYADLAVVDSSLLATLPKFFAAGALMDALTHAIESIGSPHANPWTEAMCMQAIGLIGQHARRFVEDPADPDAADPLALAACLAGASFTNTGLGIVHALTHPVFNYFGGHHGTTNGILLADVMRFNLPAMREKYAKMAPILADPSGGDDFDTADPGAAEAAIESVRALAHDIGIPPTLGAIGTKAEYLDRMAMEASKSGTVQTNPVPANEGDMKSIYTGLLG